MVKSALILKKFTQLTSSLFAIVFSQSVIANDLKTCGGERPRVVEDGEYYIHLPKAFDETRPLGAILYLHGHRGKAVNAIRNQNFLRLADELGVAFVAVQGINGTWSFPTAPRDLRDENAFFENVLIDLQNRFGVNRHRTLLAGFSSGAFMTWYLACENANQFGGYAPIAGAFWEPLPTSCPSKPPYLFHVHGTSDKVVPLAGRWLGGGRWKQGDVFQSFDIWRRQAGLTAEPPVKNDDGELKCDQWKPASGFLELCLHAGGHNMNVKWIERAWKNLSKLKSWS